MPALNVGVRVFVDEHHALDHGSVQFGAIELEEEHDHAPGKHVNEWEDFGLGKHRFLDELVVDSLRAAREQVVAELPIDRVELSSVVHHLNIATDKRGREVADRAFGLKRILEYA